MPTLDFRQHLLDGETAIGTFQLTNSTVVSEAIGIAGMDFTILDQEHGPLTAETCQALAAAAQEQGCSPIVRVRRNDPAEIQRALDIGAAGVQIPQIQSVEDAEAAANAARFYPVGERGLSPYVRAGDYVGSDDYTERQNEEATVLIHIEGERGIEAVDDILEVEGIDVLFLGPYDISQSLGIPGQVRDERVEDLMDEVCDKAAEAGKVVGTYADDPEMANRWLDVGVQYVAVGLGARFLTEKLEAVLADVDA